MYKQFIKPFKHNIFKKYNKIFLHKETYIYNSYETIYTALNTCNALNASKCSSKINVYTVQYHIPFPRPPPLFPCT